jgi:hypothetical protein
MNTDYLIENVIEQMKIDIQNDDWTAIAELLAHTPTDVLLGFLSDLGIKGESK